MKEHITKTIFLLDSVIGLIERDKAHAVRFAQAGAVLMLIAVGTLAFGACVPLTGIPFAVLVAAFVICLFIGSQLFGGAILVMEEDQLERTVTKTSSAHVRRESVPSRELSTFILHRDTGATDPERPFKAYNARAAAGSPRWTGICTAAGADARTSSTTSRRAFSMSGNGSSHTTCCARHWRATEYWRRSDTNTSKQTRRRKNG